MIQKILLVLFSHHYFFPQSYNCFLYTFVNVFYQNDCAMSYSTFDESSLLNLLGAGDEQAFNEIYRRYWKRMLAMAYLRLKRSELAEDVVQDVFSALWKRRDQIQITNLESWLATAVKFKVITLINRSLKRELAVDDLPDSAVLDKTADLYFMEQHIMAEINKLPEKCRLVFTYSRQLGLSNNEIAQKLNISEKTVEMHLSVARRKLSLNLQDLLHSIIFIF